MDELLISFLLIAEGTQAFLHSRRMAFLLGLCTDSPAPVEVGSTPRIYIYIYTYMSVVELWLQGLVRILRGLTFRNRFRGRGGQRVSRS